MPQLITPQFHNGKQNMILSKTLSTHPRDKQNGANKKKQKERSDIYIHQGKGISKIEGPHLHLFLFRRPKAQDLLRQFSRIPEI